MTRVPLAAILKQRPCDVEVHAAEVYQFAGIKSFGGGFFRSVERMGSEFAYRSLTRLRAGDLVYGKLMAWEGGISTVPEDCAGCVVSPEYPVFEIDRRAALPEYIGYYFRTRASWDQLATVSMGTNVRRRRVHPTRFLEIEVPLPSIEEQRRLVRRLAAVESAIMKAESAGADIAKEAEALLGSVFRRITANAKRERLGDVAPLKRRPVQLTVDGTYQELGVRSFGRGIFHKPTLHGANLTWQALFRVVAGDVVISNIKAWEGAIAVAGPQDEGRVGSHRYLTLAPMPGKVAADFLRYYLLSTEGLGAINEASPGSADRNRTLSQKALLRIYVPLPSFERQVWFDDLQAKVRGVLECHAWAESGLRGALVSLLNKEFAC